MAEFKGFGGKLKIGNQEIDLASWEVKASGLYLPAVSPNGHWGPSPLKEAAGFISFDLALLSDYTAMIQNSIAASPAVPSGLFSVKTYSNGNWSNSSQFTMADVQKLVAEMDARRAAAEAKAAKLAWLEWAWGVVRSRAFVARPRRPIGWLWPERN
jgi:hypothetical protein